LHDHQLEGKTVFSAAEAAIELARVVKINFPQAVVNNLTDAYFPRFLRIPNDAGGLAVSVSLKKDDDPGITASLLSSVKSKTGNISRTVEHARVKFAVITKNLLPVRPFCSPTKLEGECLDVPAAVIYRELVPFGKAYQNISGDLSVSCAGAQAFLSGGDTGADDDLLGSPFPFDAALQMACVWAQRFTDVVVFPIGFVRRAIYQKTKKGAQYLGRVEPVAVTSQPFVFNAWIFDMQGSVCEEIQGIRMQDVSRGKMKPPAWIKQS
jgi:hypothetical protein